MINGWFKMTDSKHTEHGCCHGEGNGISPVMVRDPVCGMSVDPLKTAHHHAFQGKTHHFCSARCLEKFRADPASWLKDEVEPQASAPAGARYTCPMHPEIVQDHPGTCPICGMALEPMSVSLDDGPSPELADMSRRFWFGLVLAAPIVILDMGGHFFGLEDLVSPRWSQILQLVFAVPVVLWTGGPLLERGARSVVTGHLNMFTLIAMGLAAAFLYSLAAILVPGFFPASVRMMDGSVPVYFEAAAVITVLVLLGQVLELRARDRTGQALRALLDLAPRIARRIRADGADEDIPATEIAVSDRLRVRPGESVPVDGIILEGSGVIDQSMVTGESVPVECAPGAKVIAGTLNQEGGFVMRAEAVGAQTMLARIVTMVAEAQRSRAPIQSLADRVAARFVPVVIAIALLSFAAWAIWGPPPSLAHALVAAVSVLLIACPCALGLATPMSIMVGMGRGAQSGILIRDAEALQSLEDIDTLVLDKTGTLTQGRPRLLGIEASAGFSENDLLQLGAAVERSSEHPLARAIVEAAQERGLALAEATDFESANGRGVRARVGARDILIGQERWFAGLGIDPGPLHELADARRKDGSIVMFIAIDGVVAGLFALGDAIKETSPGAIEALRRQGLRIIMLTGDSLQTATAIGAKLGITEIHAEVLPENKRDIVRALKDKGGRVAMAGDGINDAPALAEAHVGIAMGTGTDIAMESASVTLLHGDLGGIVRATALARATMRNIRQNLFLAFIYNLLGVPIAAGLLYPLTGSLLEPAYAALAMSLSSVSVIGNALRLRYLQLEGVQRGG